MGPENGHQTKRYASIIIALNYSVQLQTVQKTGLK